MPSGVVRVRRMIAASPEEVFDAWTDEDSMSRWMQPDVGVRCTCLLDVRVGGSLAIDMRMPDGNVVPHVGTYRVVERPHKLVFTWSSPRTDHQETLISVELHAVADGTELTLVHEALPDSAVDPHSAGWQRITQRLGEDLRRTS